ncbi:MAG: translation initiation factor IF-2, partial [Cytophagales bacterium]
MAEEKSVRLGQASRKLNVGHNTILEFLAKKGITVENNPNAKLSPEQFNMLAKEFASSASEKLEASHLTIGIKPVEVQVPKAEPEINRKKAEEEESVLIKNLGSKDIVKPKEESKPEKVELEKPKLEGIKVLGKIALENEAPKKKEPEKVEPKEEPVSEAPIEVPKQVVEEKQVEQELIKAKADKLQGLKVVDKIQLPTEKKNQPVASSDVGRQNAQKRPRKRLP